MPKLPLNPCVGNVMTKCYSIKCNFIDSKKRLRLYRSLLKVIVHKAVPERPYRSEPQVRKRRPKIYPMMTKPQHELRQQLQTA